MKRSLEVKFNLPIEIFDVRELLVKTEESDLEYVLAHVHALLLEYDDLKSGNVATLGFLTEDQLDSLKETFEVE